MNINTEQDWKERINDASVEELFASFDEEAGWSAIQNKMNASVTKKWSLYIVWKYAAVLLFGLMLFFLFDRENKSDNQTFSARRSLSVQKPGKAQIVEAKTIGDSLFLAERSAEESSVLPQKQQIRAKDEVHKVIPEITEVKQEQHIAVAVPQITEPDQVELKVVYAEDLQNENNTTQYLSVKKKKRKMIELNKPQSGENISQELPVRNIIYALNH